MSADDEILDVFDDEGRQLGTKRRGDVHRDGDWHLAFHLWVVAPAGVLLQRRSRGKSSWPGFLDASAAGHLLAGESIRDGLREVEEELGATYAFDDLARLGVHRIADTERSGAVNRELQHVFAVRDARPLAAWHDFDRTELAGLVLIGHDGFATLAAAASGKHAEAVAVHARSWDGSRETGIQVTAAELVPAPYLRSIGPALRRLGQNLAP